MDDKVFLGCANGLGVYVSKSLIAQKGLQEVMSQLRLERRYPVKTDLSGNVVMVEARSQEEAIYKYLNRSISR